MGAAQFTFWPSVARVSVRSPVVEIQSHHGGSNPWREPVDRHPASRHRTSTVDPSPCTDPNSGCRMVSQSSGCSSWPGPMRGATVSRGRSTFGDRVRRIRVEVAKHGLMIAYALRGDTLVSISRWLGRVRRFPFTQEICATRYVLCCRLKYSRWSWMSLDQRHAAGNAHSRD